MLKEKIKERGIKMSIEEILTELNNGRIITIPVESSNIATIGYNPFTKVLSLLFVKGTLYKYDNVDVDTVINILKSDSIGKAFHKYINKKFTFTRLNAMGGVEYRG